LVIRCITSFYHLIRIYHGNIAIKNGQAKVFDYILSEKREINLYLIFNLYKTDCVDNFKENFTLNHCLNETFKCGNGHCYNLTFFNDQTSNCNASKKLVSAIGTQRFHLKFIESLLTSKFYG
jgi:hypothetical protein